MLEKNFTEKVLTSIDVALALGLMAPPLIFIISEGYRHECWNLSIWASMYLSFTYICGCIFCTILLCERSGVLRGFMKTKCIL